MMHALVAYGLAADMVVGSSVGAMNCAYYAGTPTLEGVKRLAAIWRGLRRQDVFPISLPMLLGFMLRSDFLISSGGIRGLVEDHLPYGNLEDARIPVYIVTTDIASGDTVVLSRGSAADAIVASTAIPGVFPPVKYRDCFLADGAISNNTPITVAIEQGAERLIILPTGFACAEEAPPTGAVANALHALTLLTSRQLTTELEHLSPAVKCHVVPPLCPLVGSPYDFSRSDDHMDRAIRKTEMWIMNGGLENEEIPNELRPHKHRTA